MPWTALFESGGVAVVVEPAGEAQSDQGVQNLLDVVARGALEAPRKLLEVRRSRLGGEQAAEWSPLG